MHDQFEDATRKEELPVRLTVVKQTGHGEIVMSDLVENGKMVGGKAKALTNAGVAKLKGIDWKAQGAAAKAKADVARNKIVSTWHSGVTGKAICIVGALAILWVGSCVFTGNDADDSGVVAANYSRFEKLTGWERLPSNVNMFISLRNAASPRCKPIKGSSFVHLGVGLKISNYSINDHGAVVEISQDGLAAIGNLAAATSGDLGNINDPDDEGRVLYVETIGEYTQGEQLEAGVYEYVGLETLENAIGKQAVRAFRQWPKDKAEPIMKSVVHNKELIEAEKDRLREETKQAEKKKYEEKAKAKHDAKMKDFTNKLKPEIFDVMRYVVVQKSIADKFKPRNLHIEEMHAFAEKGDWDKVFETADKWFTHASAETPRELIEGLVHLSQRRGFDMEYSGGGMFSSENGFIKPEDFTSTRETDKRDGEVYAFILEIGKNEIRFVIKGSCLRLFMLNSKSYIATRGAIKEFCKVHANDLKTANGEALRKSLDEFLLSH